MKQKVLLNSKAINVMIYFVLIASVGLYCILAYNFWKRNMFDMLIAQTILVIFHIVLFGQCIRKNVNVKALCYEMLSYLVITIVLNLTLFMQGSFLTPDTHIGNKNFNTTYEYFEHNFIQKETNMSFTDYRSFSLSVFYDFVKEKEVIVDDRIVEDEIVYYLISGLNDNYNLQKIVGISDDFIKKIEYKYPNNVFKFYNDSEKIPVEKELYLYTGTEWNASEVIYAFDYNGKIYVVPNLLLSADCIDMQESEVEKPSSKDIVLDNTYVFWEYEVDETVIHHSQIEEHNWSIGVRNLIYVSYLFVIGIFALFPLFRKISDALVIFLALPLGTILHILSVILVGSFNIKISLYSIVAVTLIISIFMNRIFSKKSRMMEKQKIKCFELAFSSIYSLILFIYFSFNVNIWLSYDSFMSIYLGKYIAYNGEFKSILETLSSFSLGTPIINTGAILFGVDLLYAFQPIMTFMGMGAVIVLLAEILETKYTFSNRYNIGMSIMSVVLFVSTPMVGQSKEWMHNNMTIGVWFGISIAMLILYYFKRNKLYLFIAFPYLMAASLIRIEGPLFATVLLVCLKILLQDKRAIRYLSSGILICSLLQFVLYYQAIGNIDSPFWTPLKSIAMISILILYVIYLFVEDYLPSFFCVINKNIDYTMLICLGIVAIVFSMFKYELAISNIMVLAQLFFGMGYYGGFIFVLFVNIIVNLRINMLEDKLVRFLITFLSGFIIMMYDLVFFRKPLHNNSGDSTCRMLLHISFIACIFIAITFLNLYQKEHMLQKEREVGNEQ